MCDINVGLSIGTIYADLFTHQNYQVGCSGDEIAVKTVLGRMLVGGSRVITNNSVSCNSLFNTTFENLNEHVKQFWQIDYYVTVLKSKLISPTKKESYSD